MKILNESQEPPPKIKWYKWMQEMLRLSRILFFDIRKCWFDFILRLILNSVYICAPFVVNDWWMGRLCKEFLKLCNRKGAIFHVGQRKERTSWKRKFFFFNHFFSFFSFSHKTIRSVGLLKIRITEIMKYIVTAM